MYSVITIHTDIRCLSFLSTLKLHPVTETVLDDEVGVLRRLINCEYGRRLTLKSRDKIRAKNI